MTLIKYHLRNDSMMFEDLCEDNTIGHGISQIIPFRERGIKRIENMEEAYHQLPLVHNGGQALAMFPKLFKLSGKELEQKRKGMLDYCGLDTLSMVEVLNVLWKAIK